MSRRYSRGPRQTIFGSQTGRQTSRKTDSQKPSQTVAGCVGRIVRWWIDSGSSYIYSLGSHVLSYTKSILREEADAEIQVSLQMGNN